MKERQLPSGNPHTTNNRRKNPPDNEYGNTIKNMNPTITRQCNEHNQEGSKRHTMHERGAHKRLRAWQSK